MPFCSPFPVTEHTATGWWETKSYNVKWESHTQLLRVSIHSWSLNMLWASFLFMLFQIWRHKSHQDRMPSGSKHSLNVGPNVRLMFCRSMRDWACYSSPLPALFLTRHNEMAASENQEIIHTMPLLTLMCVSPSRIGETNVCSRGYLAWVIFCDKSTD